MSASLWSKIKQMLGGIENDYMIKIEEKVYWKQQNSS